MKKINTWFLLVGFLFAGSAAVGQSLMTIDLPVGDWTFTALPDKEQNSAVVVYSVTTEANKGLAITRMGLHNRSDKAVGSAKVEWNLYEVDDTDSEKLTKLNTGLSPVFGVSIAPGERKIIDFPLVKFTDLYGSHLESGQQLSGNFQLIIRISTFSIADKGAVEDMENSTSLR